ncbi:outer membrane beta-barrel protein [Edaphobacter sp.]|uniref:outer membrane beta-barrel protein n=1 Tax=Edaphobacter sp. TaxID=1934404 RepID=UPI002DB60863|nr:outer membrane beta-barrel protein [Edaphobacter sp.]HEU5341333.1 outer membrane beta-barrel protein [Edaphobacter sp.]
MAVLALLPTLFLADHTARAQAAPTAIQPLRLSAFGGVTGTYTNFNGGKNAGLTLGGDLTFQTVPYVRPSLELRGTAPFDSGKIDRQINFLIGPKVEYPWHRFHPYGDLLFGRGLITFLHGGYPQNGLLYVSSGTAVYSFGMGVDYDLTNRWAAKADFQLQHWHTPITGASTIYPKAITFGVVYHFDFNNRRRQR